MCLAPVPLPEIGFVGCRKCWQCRRNRIDDWVGRCIAESHSATESLAVTLTYGGGDVPEAGVLCYSDFQRFMKRLRKAGFKVRYIVAGEYGSAKGRAHWHAILFFDGASPVVADDPEKRAPEEIFFPRFPDDPAGRINWSYWPHGYAWIERPSYEAFSYVVKYVLKSEDMETSVGHLAMSKKPPLGDAYFRNLAERHVEQGLAIQGFEYGFRDVFKKNGERRKFLMQGKTRENYIEHYIRAWAERRGGNPPWSEAVDAYLDRQVKWSKRDEFEMNIRALSYKADPSWRPNAPRVVHCIAPAGMKYVVSRDEVGQYWAALDDGVYKWRKELKSRAAIRSALRGVLSPENVTADRNM